MSGKILKMTEGTATLIKLGVAVGSAWWLWRKYQNEQEREITNEALTQEAIRTSGGVSATTPLVEQGPQALPSRQPQVVPYAGDQPDKEATARALPTSQSRPLEPDEIAKNAFTQLTQTGTEKLFDALKL